MFWLIKLVFTKLSNFGGTVATKCFTLSNELCMARPTLIYFKPIELFFH